MRAVVTILGSDILCRLDKAGRSEEVRIPLTGEALATLMGWAQRYRRAVRLGDPSPLPDLGAALFAAEAPYTKPDFEYEVLLPGLISAITGYSISFSL